MSVETTVIIPTYNRPERLADCLAALMRAVGASVEVVVVDDGGSADLAPVVARYPSARLIRQSNAGPAAARNLGAEVARGEFLVFTDDDCLPAAGWLEALIGACRRSRDALVGGSVRNILSDNPYSAASQALCDFLLLFFEKRPSAMAFFTSNCIACSRATYLALGGFDTRFPLAAAEDRDLGMRWRASGRPMVFVREAVLGHSHHLTLSSFVRQHATYGRGARHLHRIMRERGQSPIKFEVSGFHLQLLLHPFQARSRQPVRQAALLVLSQAAMVYGYVSEMLRSGQDATTLA